MKQFGLIGCPLKHSFSAKFFTEKFRRENIDAVYNNFEIISIDLFPNIVKNNPLLIGLNVTIPYKEDVIHYLDELDDTASYIGAVNVIKIEINDDRIYLKGYNSDVIGFQNSIKPLLKKNIHNKALILGTGGAAKAVKYGLEKLGVECKCVSRKKLEDNFVYSELNKNSIDEYKIIVNASPLGTFPNVDDCPDIPYQYLSSDHLLYDLVYNPPLTKFLSEGQKRGAEIKNGYEMLELQALAAWNIWNE